MLRKLFILLCITILCNLTIIPNPLKAECDQSVADCINAENSEETKQQNTEIVQSSSDINSFTTFIKLLFALILIIFLIYWLLRFINKQSKSIQKNHLIQSLGGVGLGPNRSVQLVKVGERILVIGVGEDVQLIKEITDEVELQQLLEKRETTLSIHHYKQPFSAILEKLQQKNLEEKPTTVNGTLEKHLIEMKKARLSLFDRFKNRSDQNE